MASVKKHIPYTRKVWRVESLVNLLFSSIWQKKVWQMNRSAKGLLIVTTNLAWRIADDSPNSPNLPAIWYN